MMTSTRPRDVGGSFASRRGHGSQLSISDPSHHVTEAIGTMYGEDDDSGAEDMRPLSFIASKPEQPAEERLRLMRTTSDQTSTSIHGMAHVNGINGGSGLKKAQTFPLEPAKSPLPPPSPTTSLRETQASASASQFPLTNIDNANDIAQELSNLQALRRMSMDVGNTTDPDLLPFSGVSLMAIPSIAPKGDDDEADPSRLLWVPARVHPELEPTAFKNFLENRVQTMKRRSGESFLSVDGLQRNNSGSLRRKKSMLSRQVNTSSDGVDEYVDGAEKLGRQRSLTDHATPELSLDELVNDPTKAVQKLAQETTGEGDSPILPVAPGMGLRRSTKTTYRKGGSQRYGERVPFSKRVTGRQTEKENTEEVPPVPTLDASIAKPLMRVNSEPITENYSRPTRTVRRQQNFSRETLSLGMDEQAQDGSGDNITSSSPSPQSLPVRSSSTSAAHGPASPIPQIVETPPAEESPQAARAFPERSSSQKTSQQALTEQPPVDGPPARSAKRPGPGKLVQPPASAPKASLKERGTPNENALKEISHPTALPGSGGTTTSSLTIIPTFDTIERKFDKRGKEKDDSDSISSPKSTSSWKWFKSDDKDKKKKEKEKEKEREEQARKAKGKTGDKSHDNARLDVLQSSIDNVPKGRESLRLDRDSIEVPHEERKKETNRKSSDSKKEREGFFGGLFGGSKKKSDKESSHKKKEHRALSPEPPPRQLRPDIDYPWTRFQIIEERAIYRMAHIKLANPRRSLHSQVLLSNFMYSYLAKVQAMHPGLQVPASPQQKRQEEERKRREAEQAQLQMEQMAPQAAQDGSFDFEYHRSGNQYGDAPIQHDGSVQYIDDAQIFEYEHGGDPQQHHGENGGYHAQDGYPPEQHVPIQGQGPGQKHARQGSVGAGQGKPQQQQQQQQQQQAGYYYGRGDTKQFDDDDENSDMW